MTSSDGNARYKDTADIRYQRRWFGQLLGIQRRKVHDETHHRLFGEIAAANPKPPNFDFPGQFARRTDHQLAATRLEKNAIVAHQHGWSNLPATPGKDEIEGEARFPCTGGAPDQYRTSSDPDRRCMDTRAAAAGHTGAGSLTTKRAPATVVSVSTPAGAGRFSAQMRPPCASMICFEIDRPKPEFCPKPWCGRSV